MGAVLKAYWPSVAKHKSLLITTVLVLLVLQAIDVVPLFYIRKLMNLIASGERGANRAYELLAIIAAFGVIIVLSWFLFDVLRVFFGTRTMRDLDKRSFRALIRQSLRFFEDRFSGSLVKNVNKFRDSFDGIADHVLLILCRDLFLSTFILGIFFHERPTLGWLFLGWLAVFLAATCLLSRWQLKHDTESAKADTAQSGALADSLSNALTVKTFAREAEEEALFDQAVDECYEKRVPAWIISMVCNLARGLLIILCEIGLLLWMIGEWRENRLTPGDFVFFQIYVGWLCNNLRGLGNALNRIVRGIADAKEMADDHALEPDVKDMPGATDLHVTTGEVAFQDITFSYKKGDQAKTNGAIRDFRHRIPPGTNAAVVGPSGAGKSTLMKLILRCMDVQSDGGIEIDGQDIRRVRQASLRRQVAYVPQQPELFHRTIRQNIAFAKPGATEAEIIEAAKRAHAWEFIEKLEHGLDTKVGEKGVKLSGGERQRIAIARAFLADAPIIVLDEATSALDTDTERLIQHALAELFKGRTSIVIAHRLSTVCGADVIIVINEGRIDDIGTHPELLAKGGLYARHWQHQSSGFIA